MCWRIIKIIGLKGFFSIPKDRLGITVVVKILQSQNRILLDYSAVQNSKLNFCAHQIHAYKFD